MDLSRVALHFTRATFASIQVQGIMQNYFAIADKPATVSGGK
jgi:hypothetical protein